MTKAVHSAWLVIALLVTFGNAQAQDFNYTAATSSQAYQALTGTTSLGANTDWYHTQFKVGIGFTFSFAGASFDTLTLEPNGFVKFDQQRAIVLFHSVSCKLDTNNSYSLLSYSTTGTTGNKIFKIQYTNCGYDRFYADELMNYQVWLYQQDGKVEIHTGSTTYPGTQDSTYGGPTPLVGLINPMQEWTISALLISGDPATPTYQSIAPGNDLVYMDFVPPSGKVYTFTPAN